MRPQRGPQSPAPTIGFAEQVTQFRLFFRGITAASNFDHHLATQSNAVNLFFARGVTYLQLKNDHGGRRESNRVSSAYRERQVRHKSWPLPCILNSTAERSY